ncbi:hypothetical protein ACFT30_10400 [Microbacterium ureisolvens]|uniref:hypothetical protein n=1 Tax=Microbacterium ureisolvens TaxID=2781186 RepID=UPI00362855F1
MRHIQEAKPLFAENDTDATSNEARESDTAAEPPPPKDPPAGRESDGGGVGPSQPKPRRTIPILVSVVSLALVVLTIVLLAGAIADLVSDRSLTIAERTSGTVAVLSALIGVIAVCVSGALLTRDAAAGGGVARSAAVVLGTGLLLLGVSGGVSIASSIDDPCDAQCEVSDTDPTPSNAPTSPTPES